MFKVALVTDDLRTLPEWINHELSKSGIEFKAKKCKSPEDFIDFARDVDFVWTRGLNSVITDDSLAQLTQCKAVMRSGSGMDGIPIKTAKKTNIALLNTPEAISEMVAEHTVSLVFALLRQVPQMDRKVKNGKWNGYEGTMQWHLTRQTFGMVGFGLIAKNVAQMLSGFDLDLLVFDPYADDAMLEEFNAKKVSLEQLLKKSDFVSIHCPLNTETHHLIGENELKIMKKKAFLVNTSRGGVIDENALITALENKWLSGAALDVTEKEPPSRDNKLLQLENVVITPHIAAFSDEFEQKFWKASVEKIKSFKVSQGS